MYESVVNKIKEIFEGIVIDEEDGKELLVYPHPLEEGQQIDRYPALVFYPDDYNNQYSSTNANKKTIKYKAVLLTKAEGISKEDLYLHHLPAMADKVLEEVDAQWDGGFIGDQNRRVWITSDVAFFGARDSNDGQIAFMNLDILVEFQYEIT